MFFQLDTLSRTERVQDFSERYELDYSDVADVFRLSNPRPQPKVCTMNRREFAQSILAVGNALAGAPPITQQTEVNDIHSGLNAARVNRVEEVGTPDQLASIVRKA